MRTILAGTTGLLLIAARCCLADTTAVLETKINQSGFIGLEGGEIVHGVQDQIHETFHGEPIFRSWQERMLFQYVNDIAIKERIRVVLAVECQMSFTYPYDQLTAPETHQPQFSFYPDRAEGMYTFGDLQKPYLQFGFGYFPFKTNPDAKNLGDYLFRTGTYPVYVINTFNRPYARLLGLRASSTLFGSLHQDLLLTSSTLLPPLVDFSLSYLVRYMPVKCLEIGAGVSLAHCFQVDDKITTPQSAATQYIQQNGDAAYYTFAGTKPMARFAFDPKPLVPYNIFGKEDLRLYGEVCVTGWKNYINYDTSSVANHFYENRKDRTIYMVGFNVPSVSRTLYNILDNNEIKVPILKSIALDIVSVEVEHFPNKYPDNAIHLFGNNAPVLPQPSLYPSFATDFNSKVYPWYWSVYVKKTFLDRFSLIAQFARDHMRPINNNQACPYIEDVLERKGDWWWNVRLNVNY